jgi:hypothetical protein
VRRYIRGRGMGRVLYISGRYITTGTHVTRPPAPRAAPRGGSAASLRTPRTRGGRGAERGGSSKTRPLPVCLSSVCLFGWGVPFRLNFRPIRSVPGRTRYGMFHVKRSGIIGEALRQSLSIEIRVSVNSGSAYWQKGCIDEYW